MIYCDASLIVSALADEDLSKLARSFLQRIGTRSLAVSAWVATELASALAMKHRCGEIDDGERATLLSNWESFRALVSVTTIEPDDFAAAGTMVDAGPRGLRAGDALHLAIVKRAGLALATLDRDLADAAEAIGVEVALRPSA